jgi:hypothetical protein
MFSLIINIINLITVIKFSSLNKACYGRDNFSIDERRTGEKTTPEEKADRSSCIRIYPRPNQTATQRRGRRMTEIQDLDRLIEESRKAVRKAYEAEKQY